MNRRNFLASLCGLAVSFVLPQKTKAESFVDVPVDEYDDQWSNSISVYSRYEFTLDDDGSSNGQWKCTNIVPIKTVRCSE